jgi:hypothetical protein
VPSRHNGRIARKPPYEINYDRAIGKHLQAIDAKYHSVMRGEVAG